MLQRFEETIPALRECMVIYVYMHAKKIILFTYSCNLHGHRNKMLSAKMVLILIPMSLQVVLSLAISFHFLTFSFFRCHNILW